MKKLFLGGFSVLVCFAARAQFVATLQIKDTDTITGLCNRKEVYALFPMFQGQTEAVCPLPKDEIQTRLNNEVDFLKKNSQYDDKGMVTIIINCKGEVARCEIDNKTKSEELDKQIVAVFNSLGNWKAGKLNGKEVDSSRSWSFEIKKGKIILH